MSESEYYVYMDELEDEHYERLSLQAHQDLVDGETDYP